MLIEVCVNSLESALNAEKGGAERIELCSELGVGGITPSMGLIQSVLHRISIPVHVLIRPRSGNFTYSELEIEVMLADIKICKEMGVSGIVSGALTNTREIDLEKTSKLVQASEGLHFTFHRAFDWIKDPLLSLQQIEELGVQTLLTSGGKSNVNEGFENLIKLKEAGRNCTIMPGGGINLENIEKFNNSGFQAVHFSASKIINDVAYEIPVPMNSEKFLQEHIITISDQNLIKEMIKKSR
ncbi:copper homeostasis protein CutC [Gramella sp. BOM4]|nr:copper homeostasis protein CutC [Christiangramia bathymodioli]